MNNGLLKLFDKFENEICYSGRLSHETIRGYKAVFVLFIKVMPEINSTELLTSESLNEYFKRIQTRSRLVGKEIKTGVKSSTIKTHWSKLNVFFKWLEKKGHLTINPLDDIKPPTVRYDDFRKLEDNEVHKIYTAIVLHSSNSFIRSRDTMMISLLLYCGVRKGEFISLRVNDINFEKNLLTIRGETSKSKRSRTFRIHPSLLSNINDYLKERNSRGLKTEYLVASNRGDNVLSRQGLKQWVKSLNEKSGVKFHLHMFRHTFATKLDERNVSAFKIQKLLGHSSITMTQKYVRSMSTESMGEDICKLSY